MTDQISSPEVKNEEAEYEERTGNVLIDYYNTHSDHTPKNLKGFDGAAWNEAYKAEKLIWSAYEAYEKIGNHNLNTTNKKGADYLRKDVVYSHFITEALGGGAKKLNNPGLYSQDEAVQGTLIAETVLGILQVAPRLAIALTHHLGENAVKDIQNYHKNLPNGLSYQDDKQKNTLLNQTDPDKIIKAHNEFLKFNKEKSSEDIKALNKQLDQLKETSETIAKELREEKEHLNKQVADAQKKIDSLKALQSAGEELSDNDKKKLMDLQSSKAGLQNEISKVVTQTKVTQDHLESHERITQKNVASLRANIDAVETQKTHVKDSGYHTDFGRMTKFADVGYSALGTAKYAASLAAGQMGGYASEKDIASAASLMGYEAAGMVAAGLEAKDAKYYGKSAKALALVGAAAGVAGSSLMISSIADQLNNPNLTEEERNLLKAEIGLQSTAMFLSSIAGTLSVAQASAQAGSKTASMLGKAVPMLGAVASIAGAINPAKWSEFSNKEKRIDALKDSDDHSAKLLSGLLGESLGTEKAIYAVTTVVDITTGIGSAALAATGVGAGAAIIVGLVGGAISGIIQAVQQPALEALADKYAKKMRTAEDGSSQSIEEFFDGSFEQSQEKTKKAYEDFFKDLVSEDGGYDSVISVGSQGMTGTDLALAAMTKTAGEMNKTAKHYFEQYKADGGWQDGTIQLREVKGNDEIHLPDHGGGKHYLTFMTPLMASGRESTKRYKVGKNEYATKLYLHDIAGYNVIDRGEDNTTFNVSKVVNSVKTANGRVHNIDFNIKAGAGDDTYFGYDSEVNFDGGTGVDTASYTKLDNDVMTRGITVKTHGSNGVDVTKHLSAKNKIYKESIETHTEKNGKRTEKVQYRSIGFEERGRDTDVTDRLTSVEIIHGTGLKDVLDLSGNDVVEQLHGFGGDDIIIGGNNTKVITGGNGNDIIAGGDQSRIVAAGEGDDLLYMSKPVAKLLAQAEYAADDMVYIDGGKGLDLLKLSAGQMHLLTIEYVETAKLAQFAAMVASAITMGQDSGVVFDALVSYLTADQVAKFDRVVLKDIEYVEFKLTDMQLMEKTEADALKAVGVSKSVYKGVTPSDPAQLAEWAADHTADESQVYDGEIKGDVGHTHNALVHVSGQFQVVEGKTYTFRETVDDIALLVVDGQTVLSDKSWNTHTTGTFTATKTGNVKFDFYAKNVGGPSGFKLEVKEDKRDFKPVIAKATPILDDVTQNTYSNADIWSNSRPSDFANRMLDWLKQTKPTTTKNLEGEIKGDAAEISIEHFSGKIFLLEGQTYTFREHVDDYAVLEIDGVRILEDKQWKVATTATFTATKTGYVSFDFYAANDKGYGNYQLDLKGPGDTDFQTLVAPKEDAAGGFAIPVFKTAHLNGVSTGSDVLDSTFFVADYNKILNSNFGDKLGLPFKTMNTTVDTYDGVNNIKAGDMKAWAESHIATRIGSEPDAISGDLAQHQMKHFKGQIYLEAGKEYTFQEQVDDKALLIINGETLLADNTWNKHTEKTFSVTKSGFYEFEFFVKNLRGPGNYKLNIKTEDTEKFVTIDGSTTIGAALDATDMSKSVRLIGDVQSEKLTGSNHEDFIFGHRGNDVIEGGKGNDFLVGGEGHDTFVFKADSGHDLITETSREDWLNNTIKTTADLDELRFHRYGDDLVIHSTKSDNASLTLADFFEFRGNQSLQQRIVDRDGDVMLLDANTVATSDFALPSLTGFSIFDLSTKNMHKMLNGYSVEFANSYKDAMDTQFMKDARAVIDQLDDMNSGKYAEDQKGYLDQFLGDAAASMEVL